MCSDTAWSIPCCAAVSASISVEGPLSGVGAPLSELGDDGTEGRTEGGGAACVKVGNTVKVEQSSVWFTCMHRTLPDPLAPLCENGSGNNMEHFVWPNYTLPSNDNIYKWCITKCEIGQC